MTDRDDERDAIDARIEAMARAYRGAHDGEDARASETRAAILRRHAERSSQQAWLMAAAVLLAALIGLPTAWALYTGRIGGAPAPEPGHDASAPDRATTSGSASAPGPEIEVDVASGLDTETEPTALPESPETDDVLAPEPFEATETEATETERAPRATPVTAADEAAGAAEEHGAALGSGAEPVGASLDGVSPAERLAYDTAHALHFDRRDAAGAITAWDAYLADYPHGRFALEAAYNRALALVRLGRNDEARIALEPFARGDHGSYRRRESAALLDALSEE